MAIEVLAVGQEEQDRYEADQAANNNGTNGNLDHSPEEKQDTPADGANKETTEQAVDKPEVKDEKAEEAEQDADTLYFGEIAVEVEVPTEISEALKGAKIDEGALLKELFAKDGKFEVSEKTKAALDKAFGKGIVDGYLNLFKQQNQMAVDKYTKESTELQATIKANSEDFTKLVDGDEGWESLSTWAGENLSQDELGQFNAVMELPPQHYKAQRAVIEALKIKRDTATAAANGDSQVTLPTDSGNSPENRSEGLPATLTKAEFQAAINTVRYKTDRKYAEAVDNIRRASQKKGIR